MDSELQQIKTERTKMEKRWRKAEPNDCLDAGSKREVLRNLGEWLYVHTGSVNATMWLFNYARSVRK